MIYEDTRVYGPYERLDGRSHVIIIFKDGKRKTVSYPKYLKEIELDRYLKENETVDHIDGNFKNNDLSNLQVLDRSTHVSLDNKRAIDAIVSCVYCLKEFIIKGSKIQVYSNIINSIARSYKFRVIFKWIQDKY